MGASCECEVIAACRRFAPLLSRSSTVSRGPVEVRTDASTAPRALCLAVLRCTTGDRTTERRFAPRCVARALANALAKQLRRASLRFEHAARLRVFVKPTASSNNLRSID